MALTTSVLAVDAWAEVAQDAIREGAKIDVSDAYEVMLHIDVALITQVAHTGSLIRVRTASIAHAGNDDGWTQEHIFLGPTGTSDGENIDDAPLAAGSTTITISSTTGYTTYGENSQLHFIEDSADIANSELVFRIDHTANTNLTIADGTTTEHATASDLYSIAQSYVVALPMSTVQFQIIYDNKFDADGAAIACRCRLVKTTGI